MSQQLTFDIFCGNLIFKRCFAITLLSPVTNWSAKWWKIQVTVRQVWNSVFTPGKSGIVSSKARHRCDVSWSCCPSAKRWICPPLVPRFGVIPQVSCNEYFTHYSVCPNSKATKISAYTVICNQICSGDWDQWTSWLNDKIFNRGLSKFSNFN